jgi:hypothetical protein
MSVAGTQFDSLRFSGLETRRLAWAFAVSLTVHALAWSGYEWGRELNFWQQLHWPAWLRIVQKLQVVPLRALTQNVEPPLVFVDVNPEQAVTEAPKNAKYYSDRNSRAANPDADRNANQPKLNGRQTEVPKTETVDRSQFSKLQPIPDTRHAPNEEELRPKPALNPGDLTLASPADLQRQKQENPAPDRPRTLREVRAQQPSRLPGAQMWQEGGVHQQALVPSFDVKATLFGAYDRAFIEAVSQRWYDLLDSRQFALDRSGRVVLRFRLNYDGRITDMKTLENTVGEVLGYVCQKAVADPAPYAPWPSDMRREVDVDYREITFTFYYY